VIFINLYFAQRFSVCDVLRSETEQNRGERSATSEPHILC